MPLSRLSIASIVALPTVFSLTGCQSLSDGFRYGFGFDPDAPAYVANPPPRQAPRSSQSRAAYRRGYDYDAPRDGSSSTYNGPTEFKRARYYSSETSPSGVLIDRDRQGNVVRTGSRSGDTTTYRDPDGAISSTVSRSPAGVDTERDASGQIVTTSSANPSGDTVTYRDGSGKILGTRYTSPSGEVTYRDATGRITGSDFR